MATILTEFKISELPVADSAAATDQLEASQAADPGQVSRRITLDQVSTVVAASDQIGTVIDAAIGAIPPPPPNDWASITGKPATFPPTVPIPYTSISGTPTIPTTLPPTGTAGGDLSGTYPNPLVKPSITNGQVLTTVAGLSAWATPATPPPATTVSATPPGSPVDGQLWFFTDASVGGGNLYIRYNDGTSTAWVPASTATAGSVVQTVSFQTGELASGTAIIPHDDTIPQIGEGTEFMTCAITPRSATSKLVIDVTIHLYTTSASGGALIAALFQGATANALAVGHLAVTGPTVSQVSFKHVMVSGTTSATTFRVRGGCGSAGTVSFNSWGGTRSFGGAGTSSIVIQEVL